LVAAPAVVGDHALGRERGSEAVGAPIPRHPARDAPLRGVVGEAIQLIGRALGGCEEAPLQVLGVRRRFESGNLGDDAPDSLRELSRSRAACFGGDAIRNEMGELLSEVPSSRGSLDAVERREVPRVRQRMGPLTPACGEHEQRPREEERGHPAHGAERARVLTRDGGSSTDGRWMPVNGAPAGSIARMEALVPQIAVDEAEDAARRARFPAGAAIEFADLELDSRVGALDRLRAAEPISWVPALGGWLLTSHALARELLGRGEFTVWAEPNLVRASLGVMMLTSDGAEHARQRQPFDEPFRVRPVRERFATPVQRHIDALLTTLAPQGRCELVEDFAAPFAIGLAGDVLGLPLDDVARVQEFYEAFAGAMVYDGDPEPQRRADGARAELNAILLDEVRRSRTRPDNSVTSAVANDPARGLSDDEIVAQLRVILFGAIETVESTIANAVLLLLQNPDELAILRADPGFAGNVIEEGMRLIPPVAFIERWSAVPCTFGGVELAAGEFIGVSTVAANRDPAVFDAPERFDVRRGNARHHLTLSHGHHHCLGFNLGRMQCQAAVTAIFERLHGLELVHAPEPSGFAFRRPAALELRWRT
jgi:cytochrome P450